MTRRQFGFGLAAAALMRGETPQEQKGRALVAKVIGGLGGDAFRFMKTRTETGEAYSFYRNDITGFSTATIYVKYLAADAQIPKDGVRILQRESYGGKQEERKQEGKKQEGRKQEGKKQGGRKQDEDAVIFTADGQGYDVSYRGAQPLADSRIKQFHDTTIQDVFYILRERMNEPGLGFEYRGKDVLDNQPVELLGIFDLQNRDVTVWVNADTYLPVQQKYTRWDPIINDRRVEITHFAKYRDVGNQVMWPYDVERERDGEKVYEMYATHVSVDDPLPDSMFELPSGVKMLKRM